MPSDLKLFILAGQSNMVGQGLLTARPVGYPAYGSQIWNYRMNGTWQNPAADPLHDPTDSLYPVLQAGSTYEVGPGLSFAQNFLRYNPTFEIGLIPCAKAGSSIAHHARPADGVDTDTIYGASRARWEAAAASGTIEGLLFYQGETECETDALADSWSAAFTQYVADVRSDTGLPNLPVVFAPVKFAPGFLEDFPAGALLKLNQRQTIGIHRCMCVNNLDTTLNVGDDAHLNTASHILLGRRFADAMRILGACE